MTTEQVYLVLDSAALLAVAIMLHLTEPRMDDQTQSTETMEQRIHAMLNDAMENEYDISTWTVDDIVADLLAFADLREDEIENTIRPHVITWKALRQVPT